MFICMQKINFISNFFFELLLRHCKLAVLETLGTFDHPQQESNYRFAGNFHVYLHTKNQLHHPLSLLRYWNIAGIPGHTHSKIFQTSYFGCFGKTW